MTHTYLETLSTNRDKVRLRIGDTITNAGPRPDGRNFSDDEIAFILSEESDRVNGAIAHCFEILEAEWASFALSEQNETARFDAKETTEKYKALAAKWRSKPGGASETERSSGLITLQRTDPYTDITEYST